MTEPRPASSWVVLATGVAVVWYGALVSLALLTSNPVTVNARQVLSSRLVVVGTVDEGGQVKVVRTVAGALPVQPLKVVLESQPPAGELILPLTKEGGDFRVTPTMLPRNDRLVYPATEDTLRQLDAILRDAQK